MRFVMLGFTSDGDMRKFRFQAIAAEQARIEVAVEADLALVRRFQIPPQELPLLCWHVLQTRGSTGVRSLTVTESDLRGYACGRDFAPAGLSANDLFRTRKTGGIFGSSAPAEQCSSRRER